VTADTRKRHRPLTEPKAVYTRAYNRAMTDVLDLAEHFSWGTPAHTPLPGRPSMLGLLLRRREPRTDWTEPDQPEPDPFAPFGDWDTPTLRQLAIPAEVLPAQPRPTDAELLAEARHVIEEMDVAHAVHVLEHGIDYDEVIRPSPRPRQLKAAG
jgi:hypothetical protein